MLAAALVCAFVSHAQETKSAPKLVRTEPNGVMIYEAQGVESVEATPVRPVVVERQQAPTFEQLSKAELQDRLHDVERKLQLARDEEDPERIATYEQEKTRVTERIAVVE